MAALFKAGGNNSSLGQKWRVRTGSSPYIEFVVNYLLQRVTGRFQNLPPLPFQSDGDESRLEALTLNVVEIVLSRYVLPADGAPLTALHDEAAYLLSATRAAALQAVSHCGLAESVSIEPCTADAKLAKEDFDTSKPLPIKESEISNGQSDMGGRRMPSTVLPKTRSPGFALMTGMLSGGNCNLLIAIVDVLISRNGGHSLSEVLLAEALYLQTPATFSSAKTGAGRQVSDFERQSLLKNLRPPMFGSSLLWRTSALRSLCNVIVATLSRESSFLRCGVSLAGKKYVPLLKFRNQPTQSVVDAFEPHLLPMSQLLISMESRGMILSSLVRNVGIISASEELDVQIATSAAAILFYLERSLHPSHGSELFRSHHSALGGASLAHSFERRLRIYFSRPVAPSDTGLIQLLFDRLLYDLRRGQSVGIANSVFGSSNFLCTMLQLLDNGDFVASNMDIACKFFETIHYLTSINGEAGNIVVATKSADLLRSSDYWNNHLSRMFTLAKVTSAETHHSDHALVFHSVSWILKSLANELYLAAGHYANASSSQEVVLLAAPRPSDFTRICQDTFSEAGYLNTAILLTPLQKPDVRNETPSPSCLAAVSASKEDVVGSPYGPGEFCRVNVDRLLQALKSTANPDTNGVVTMWVHEWNSFVELDCASAHLTDSLHAVLGAAVACSNNVAVMSSDQMRPVRGAPLALSALEKIVQASDGRGDRSLTEAVFPRASRNLAHFSAVAISHGLTKINFSEASDSLDGISNLVVNALALANDDGSNGSLFSEHVTFLASCLLSIGEVSEASVMSIADAESLAFASRNLMGISSTTDSTKFPAVASLEAVVARACPTLMLDVFENHLRSDMKLFCDSFLSPTVRSRGPVGDTALLRLVKLLPTLDEGVAPMLGKLIPGLSLEIVNARVFTNLEEAAAVYRKED